MLPQAAGARHQQDHSHGAQQGKRDAALVELSKGKEIKPGPVDIWQLGLSSYGSVIAFGERARSLDRIDIAILNAAVMLAKQRLNPTTGHDEIIQVNYLSTIAVLLLLLAVVKEKPDAQPPRITLVSSEAAVWTKFKERNNDPLLSALDTAKGWTFSVRYFLSKLPCQVFVANLAKKPRRGWCTIVASALKRALNLQVHQEQYRVRQLVRSL